MRILLVLDNLSSSCGANVGIIYELTKTWLAYGNEVYCLAREDKFHELDREKETTLSGVWTFKVLEDDVLNGVTKSDRWINASSLGKAFFAASHLSFLQKLVDKKYFESSEIRNEYKRQIETVCAEDNFDAVIAVTEPFYIAEALANANIGNDKYVIMMDPYTNNPSTTQRLKDKHLQKELNVFEAAQKVFALDFVGNDMDYLPAELKQKVVTFRVPKVQKLDMKTATASEHSLKPNIEKIQEFTDATTKIIFVYVGQLYDDIRNPELMLKLFTKLPENYVLNLYGGGSEKTLARYKEILGDRLILHGWVSSSESIKAQKEADVLINLNNNIKNMLPSKLIEYINTGKPILNICQIPNCPSFPYMERYPMALSASPDQNIDDIARNLKEFAQKYKGQTVDHSQIEELYADCISENVANMILKTIEKRGITQ
ncbi:glycosyl transferase GT4 family [Butyrivibrio proteoclasticus B316]|uniref:Glycosyl transferase GT4 family n=1 Tax=Butyrivibrio proteoclasticus (strain ATCC 51982 / DSM 14932 / B316) TaxID=515622 RepID=E0RZB8_BUTPB|nr:glycosyltransferase [Butyrivibrio proteoclasticus]ADL33115.1 glycosyl transferase GT4 family [Butyrivibrio proteoclasticus B316]